MSTATVEALCGELAGYDLGKGTVRFRPLDPLPETVVRKAVALRLAENEALDRSKRR